MQSRPIYKYLRYYTDHTMNSKRNPLFPILRDSAINQISSSARTMVMYSARLLSVFECMTPALSYHEQRPYHSPMIHSKNLISEHGLKFPFLHSIFHVVCNGITSNVEWTQEVSSQRKKPNESFLSRLSRRYGMLRCWVALHISYSDQSWWAGVTGPVRWPTRKLINR